MRNEIILVGGGGHCKSVIDVIELEGVFTIEGIVDLSENVGKSVSGYPIIGTDDDLKNLGKPGRVFLVTAGHIRTSEIRIRLFQLLSDLNLPLATIVSPHAYVSKRAQLGAGTVVMHFAFINTATKVGDNCIVNTRALIEHDTIIHDHCHISTGAIVNGGVQIGAGTFYGSGAVSKEYITIPENSFIKANSIIK